MRNAVLLLLLLPALATAGTLGSTTSVINTAPGAQLTISPDDSALAGTQVLLPSSGTKTVSANATVTDYNGYADINQAQGNCSWYNDSGVFNSSTLSYYSCDAGLSCLASCSMLLYPTNATGDYGVNVTVNDSGGNASTQSVAFSVPNAYPQYTLVQTNNSEPAKSASVLFLTAWFDYSGLAGYLFESNFSGSGANDSFAVLNGLSNVTQTAKTVPSAAGAYYWRVYANNTLGNFNDTGARLLTVLETATPTPSPTPAPTPTPTPATVIISTGGDGGGGYIPPFTQPTTIASITVAPGGGGPAPHAPESPGSVLALPSDAAEVFKVSEETVWEEKPGPGGKPLLLIEKKQEIYRYRKQDSDRNLFTVRVTLKVSNVGRESSDPFELKDVVSDELVPFLPSAEFYHVPDRLDGLSALVWRVPSIEPREEEIYAYQVFAAAAEHAVVTKPATEELRVDKLTAERKESELRKLLFLAFLSLLAVLIGVVTIHALESAAPHAAGRGHRA